MKNSKRAAKRCAACLLAVLVLVEPALGPGASAYVLNRNIAFNGSCPVPQRWATTAGNVDRRWSTSLSVSPQNVLTQLTPPETAIQQIDRAIGNSFAVWTSVGTALNPAALSPLTQTAMQNACSTTDGVNSICFNQSSSFFTGGVLAFTIAISWDQVGVHAPTPTSPRVTSFIGEIVDADVYFRPPDAQSFTFATREALPSNPNSFDLESVLTHELGHFFGFSHSGVLRAMMYAFATRGAPVGGVRCPSPNTGCDLPLGDDDRAGLRVLYPNPNDTVNVGSISGFILPANPLSLAGIPSATQGKPQPARPVNGIFGAHVVAVDSATGAVVAGTFGGWSCDPAQLPSHFDGFYKIEGLPVGRSYKIFVEPLDGPTSSSDIQNAINDLCSQNTANDVCLPPTVNTGFTTKIKPQ